MCKAIVIAASTLLLLAPSSSGGTEPLDGKFYRDEIGHYSSSPTDATLFVFREDGLAASGSDLAIQDNAGDISWIDGGEYIKLLIPAGRHLITGTLVKKGEGKYSWYAELWPQAKDGPVTERHREFYFERALLGMSPASVPRQLRGEYNALAVLSIMNAIVKINTHSGVRTKGNSHWIWAEAETREELEKEIEASLDSLKMSRASFFERIPPGRFKQARRVLVLDLEVESGKSYFIYPNYSNRKPWTQMTVEESLEEFGDFLPAANQKYGSEWRVGDKVLKNLD